MCCRSSRPGWGDPWQTKGEAGYEGRKGSLACAHLGMRHNGGRVATRVLCCSLRMALFWLQKKPHASASHVGRARNRVEGIIKQNASGKDSMTPLCKPG